jgi:hypothetical protein
MGSQVEEAPSPDGRPEDSPVLLHGLAELAPPLLRLPGGDRLNTWNYFTGLSGAYSKADGVHDPSRDGSKAMHVPAFLKLARAGGSAPLWGMNVTTAPTSDTEAFASLLQAQGAGASFFELGNELYLKIWRGQTPTADVYAAKAAPHAAVLRKHFPSAKLGVPLASYYMLKGEPDAWMRGLAQRQDYYDAVVLHLYMVPTELGRNGLATHTPEEVTQWAWGRADAAQLRQVYGRVRALFPTKDIWVTEWALNSTQYFRPSRNDPRFQIHQTMLAVLYDARFLLNTAYGEPEVPIMTYWTLYGQPALALLKDGKPTILFEWFRMMRQAREGADGLARLRGRTGDVFGFYRAGKLKSVLILNPRPGPVAAEIPGLPKAAPAEMQSLYSAEMLPHWGDADNPPPSQWAPPYGLAAPDVTGETVTVPPNSLTLVRW